MLPKQLSLEHLTNVRFLKLLLNCPKGFGRNTACPIPGLTDSLPCCPNTAAHREKFGFWSHTPGVVAWTRNIYFLTVWEARSLRFRSARWFLLSPLSLACRWPPPPWVLTSQVSRLPCVLIASSFKGTSRVGLGLAHRTSFYLNYPFKGLFSKYSHIQGTGGGGDNSTPNSRVDYLSSSSGRIMQRAINAHPGTMPCHDALVLNLERWPK